MPLDTLYLREIRLNREKLDGESYLAGLPVVRHLKRLSLRSPVTFLIGENGTGKSTLLEAVAVNCGFNPEGGTRNFHFSTADTHSSLYEAITVTKGVLRPKDGFFLRAESFYNLATNIDELSREGLGRPIVESYGGVSLHRQSHGESFLSLVMNRFGGNGLYLLDEPEAALSPCRQMSLLTAIHDLVKENSQFLIATHSPILMAYPGAEIYELSEKGIRLTGYEETEHYQLTKRFLEEPHRMLQLLLEDSPDREG